MGRICGREIAYHDGTTSSGWHTYTCGYCGKETSGGVVAGLYSGTHIVKWLLCTSCLNGSVCTPSGEIKPGALFGPKIEGLPELLSGVYNEARNCISVSAFTACELICRKILMHTAVDKGAGEGGTFSNYLSYLESKGYITPPMKGWVDLIRQHGNEAAHIIESPDKQRAESTLMFTAELLRLVYEMEYLSTKYQPKP